MCAVAGLAHTCTLTHIYTERERQKHRDIDRKIERQRQGKKQNWIGLQGSIAAEVPVKIPLKASFTVLKRYSLLPNWFKILWALNKRDAECPNPLYKDIVNSV